MKKSNLINQLVLILALSLSSAAFAGIKTIAKCYGTKKPNPGTLRLFEDDRNLNAVYAKKGAPEPQFFRCKHTRNTPDFQKKWIKIYDCQRLNDPGAFANGPVMKASIYATVDAQKAAAVVYSQNPHLAHVGKKNVHESFRCITARK